MMKAIIVAGGKGERLWPITKDIAKPMVKVDGKPVLEHIINLLRQNGIHDLVLALCYKPESITSYFKDGEKFGVHIQYTFENPDAPMGTAGAIKAARPLVGEEFIVTYADILRKLSVQEMIKTHQKKQAFTTLNVYQEFDEVPRSLVKFNASGEVTDFIEHPDVRNLHGSYVWTNGSFYIFNKSIFEYIPDGQPTDFAQNVFPLLLNEKRKIVVYKTTDYFLDIGTKNKLELAQTTFKPLSLDD